MSSHYPPRRVLVCPQEFKGSLDAFQATAALARGVCAALRNVEVIERPMADGGPGTAAIIASALGAEVRHAHVRGAYGADVEAPYYLAHTANGVLGIIESAAAVGLTLTPPEARDPANASSEGVGELIRDAIANGARSIVLGVGGTATMDGGAGVARALGLRLLDRNGRDLPAGVLHLARLERVEAPRDAVLDGVEVRVATDARNRLTGPEGAVAVYATQKGMPDWQAPALDTAIAHWARSVREQLDREIDVPGAGTGGGIAAGVLAATPHARIESGAALVADTIGLRDLIAGVNLVVTGEGAMDAQTAYGKTVGHVAALARDLGVPCVAVAGVVRALPDGVADAEALAPSEDASAVAAAMHEAARYASDAAERLTRRLLAHHEA